MTTSAASIEIAVNGETRRVPAGTTVAGLLELLQVTTDRVGVERNRQLVRRAEFSTTRVENGDRIEIVTFVGGG